MTEQEIATLIAQAREEGYREGLAERIEFDIDSKISIMQDDSDYFEDIKYQNVQECMKDDTIDSRGRALRPSKNAAGEPYWM